MIDGLDGLVPPLPRFFAQNLDEIGLRGGPKLDNLCPGWRGASHDGPWVWVGFVKTGGWIRVVTVAGEIQQG